MKRMKRRELTLGLCSAAAFAFAVFTVLVQLQDHVMIESNTGYRLTATPSLLILLYKRCHLGICRHCNVAIGKATLHTNLL
jgi:hypothetical protein